MVISSRNFLRSLGGACGLAVASALFSNTLVNNLPSPPSLPAATYDSIVSSVFSVPDLTGLSEEQKNTILDVYTDASRSVFYFWVGCIGIAWLLIFFIKDKGLQRKEEREAASPAQQASGQLDVEQAASPPTAPAWADEDGSTTEAENTMTEGENEKLKDTEVHKSEAAKERI